MHSFCEPVWAGPRAPWCIRAREEGELPKLGGGVKTASLCGRVQPGKGWDLDVDFAYFMNLPKVDQEAVVCRRCLEHWPCT